MMNDKRDFSPVAVITRLWESIDSRYKITFYASIICGLLAHLYQFTNKLYNYDELDATPSGAVAGLYLGRWSQALIAKIFNCFFSNTSLPLFNGMLALILFSVSACIIVRVLNINSKLFCAIIGGLCVTIPTVTCTYFYMYMSWYYALALLLATVSALIPARNIDLSFSDHPGKAVSGDLIAVLILAVATGIYQAYFPVAVVLLLSSVILKTVDVILNGASGKNTFKSIIEKGVEYVLILAAGLLLYLVINKAAVYICGTVLPTYQGMNEIGNVDVHFILNEMADSYKNVIKLLYTDVYQVNPTIAVRLMILLLYISGAVALYFVLRKKKTDDEQKYSFFTKLVLCLLVFIYPVALFLIQAMSTPQTYVYSIMMYAVIFAFILPIAMTDRVFGVCDCSVPEEYRCATRIGGVVEWLCSIAGVVIIMVYIWFANGCYQTLQYTNYHDLAYYLTMVTQIKSVEGYDDNMPVILVGCGNIVDSTIEESGLISDVFYLAGKSNTNINAYSDINIIREYLGFRGDFLWDDESQELFFTDDRVIDMPCYPKDGCMKIVDDVLVVKLGDIDNNSWQHFE